MCFKDPVARIANLLRQTWPGLRKLHGGCGPQDWQEVWITTSYSGIGFPEAAIAELVHELGEVDLELKVRFLSAFEIDDIPRRALLQHKQGPEHVFGDITSRIPREVRDKLLLDAKTKRDAVAARVAIVKAAMGNAEAKKVRARMVQDLGLEFFQAASTALAGAPMASHSWCYRHARLCPVDTLPSSSHQGGLSPRQILRLEVAGTTCVAWSSMGSHWGWLDDSSIPCLVWMHATSAAEPDLVLHECTTSFQAAQFRPTFSSELYSLQSLVTCPSDFGIPVERARRYTLMLLHTRRKDARQNLPASFALPDEWSRGGKRRKVSPGLAHAMPQPALTANSLDFVPDVMAAVFFAELRSQCGIFLRATRTQVKELYLKRIRTSRSNSSSFAGGGWSEVGIMDVICPSARVHLEACNLLHEERQLGRDLVSLSQSPFHIQANRLSACAPVLVRNSLLYSMRKKRLVLPEEALQMQGLPVPELLTDHPHVAARWPFCCSLGEIMTEAQLRAVTGNGMHVCQVGSAVLLALAMVAGGCTDRDA
jgi:hypothetical protein